MEKYFSILKQCELFGNIEEKDMCAMLACLGARVLSVDKGEMIFQEGQAAKYIGIVLSGAAQIVQDDFYGNRSILANITPSRLFGEAFACADVDSLPISVLASEDSEILLINCQRITNTCCHSCGFHKQMIYNLLRAVATKNLMLHQKIEITSKRTTREKLMAYLTSQAKLHHSNCFTIPYDRQALADYLGVERSAMSAEISRLRKDGIIDCHKCDFKIL